MSTSKPLGGGDLAAPASAAASKPPAIETVMMTDRMLMGRPLFLTVNTVTMQSRPSGVGLQKTTDHGRVVTTSSKLVSRSGQYSSAPQSLMPFGRGSPSRSSGGTSLVPPALRHGELVVRW